MLTLTVGKDKTIEFGKDVIIETDGVHVTISDGKTRIERVWKPVGTDIRNDVVYESL